jgi:hypothetical protein
VAEATNGEFSGARRGRYTCAAPTSTAATSASDGAAAAGPSWGQILTLGIPPKTQRIKI